MQTLNDKCKCQSSLKILSLFSGICSETDSVQKLNSVFLRLRLLPDSDKKLFHLFMVLNIRTLL